MENINLNKSAVENFKNGYSCSESVVKAAIDKGIVSKDLLNVATAFSGGMSSGCLCGAIAASQIVLGYLHGREKTNLARKKAKELIEEFKKSHKATCCRVLSAGYEFHSHERKAHCTKMVNDCCEILERMLIKEAVEV